MKILINDKEVQPFSLSISKKLSSINICSLEISLEDIDLKEIVNKRVDLKIYDSSYLLFEGVDSNTGRTRIDLKNEKISFTFLDKLSKLENDFLPFSEVLENQDIVEYLNSNSSGIVFQAHNLDEEQKFISKEISQISYATILKDFRNELGFDFWLKNGVYHIGNIKEIRNLTQLDVDNHKIELPESFEVDRELINKVYVSTDEDKSSFEFANETELKYPIFNEKRNKKVFYYVQDVDSISRYGEKIEIVDGITYETDLEKIEFSNHNYKEAVTLIKQNKDSRLSFQKIKLHSNNFNFGVDKLIKLDFEINGVRFEEPFRIADIYFQFDRDSTEGYYNLTLLTELDKDSKELTLLNKFEKQLRK